MRTVLLDEISTGDICVLQTRLEGYLMAQGHLAKAQSNPLASSEQVQEMSELQAELLKRITRTRRTIELLGSSGSTQDDGQESFQDAAFDRIGRVLQMLDGRISQLELGLRSSGPSDAQGIRNKNVVHVTINGTGSAHPEVTIDKGGKASKRPRVEVPDQLKEDLRAKIQALRLKIDELCAFRSKEKTALKAAEDYIRKTEEIVPLILELENLMSFCQEQKEFLAPVSQVKTSTDALVSKKGTEAGSTPQKVHAVYAEYFPKINSRVDDLETALGL